MFSSLRLSWWLLLSCSFPCIERASCHLHKAAGRPTAFFNLIYHYLIHFIGRWSLFEVTALISFLFRFVYCTALLLMISILAWGLCAITDLTFNAVLITAVWLKNRMYSDFLIFLRGCWWTSLVFFRCDRLNCSCLRRLENLGRDGYCNCRRTTPVWLGPIVSGNVACCLFDLRCIVQELGLWLLHLRKLKIADGLIESRISGWLSRCAFGRLFFKTLKFDRLVE